MVGFHYYNYAFSKDKAFNSRQTSTFMSIMNDVFARDERSHGEEEMSASFDYFKEMILKHSIERPPKSIGIFKNDPLLMNEILDYALTSYFRQFKLYKYIFNDKVRLIVTQSLPNEVQGVQQPGALSNAFEVGQKPEPIEISTEQEYDDIIGDDTP